MQLARSDYSATRGPHSARFRRTTSKDFCLPTELMRADRVPQLEGDSFVFTLQFLQNDSFETPFEGSLITLETMSEVYTKLCAICEIFWWSITLHLKLENF